MVLQLDGLFFVFFSLNGCLHWVETFLQNLFGIRKHHDAGPDIGKRSAFSRTSRRKDLLCLDSFTFFVFAKDNFRPFEVDTPASVKFGGSSDWKQAAAPHIALPFPQLRIRLAFSYSTLSQAWTRGKYPQQTPALAFEARGPV